MKMFRYSFSCCGSGLFVFVYQKYVKMIKKVLQKILACQARMLIKKHKPLVIGVTGSYGKTSSRDAIAHAISSQFSVRSAQHNLNNEYGVPLTVIGAEAPGKSIALWARVFVRWVRQMYVTD